MNQIITNPRARAYIYGVVLASIPLLQFLRLVPGEAVPLIVNIVTAVLGVGAAGLALPNTPNGPIAPVVNVYSTVDPKVIAQQIVERTGKHEL